MNIQPDVTRVDDMLPGENFLVAPRVLPRAARHHLVALYRFARMVDEIGDASGDGVAHHLDAVEADVHALYRGDHPAHPHVAGLRRTVEDAAIPARDLLDLVDANRMDQSVSRYETFEDLLGYCRLSADPVGRMVLRVFDAWSPSTVELSNRICSALQIIEHCQDVKEDLDRGRVYIPQEDLRTFAVTEKLLRAPRADDRVRALIAFQTDRGASLLDGGAPLVQRLSGWGRIAVAAYAGGGRAAIAALRRAGHDVLPGPVRPSAAAKVRFAAAALLGAGRR